MTVHCAMAISPETVQNKLCSALNTVRLLTITSLPTPVYFQKVLRYHKDKPPWILTNMHKATCQEQVIDRGVGL